MVCAGCSLLTPLLVIWLESHCYPFMSNSSMQWEAFVIPLCSTSPFIVCRDECNSVVWRKITSWRQTGNGLPSFKTSPRASPGTPFGVWMLKYWGRDKYLNGILSKSLFMCPANTLTICSDYSWEGEGLGNVQIQVVSLVSFLRIPDNCWSAQLCSPCFLCDIRGPTLTQSRIIG